MVENNKKWFAGLEALREGIHKNVEKGLHDVIARAFKNIEYYKNNQMLKGTFDFLKLVVDSWYPQ